MNTLANLYDAGWSKVEAPKFKAYLDAVDKAIQSTIGLGMYDLPDYDFACAYEDGIDPAEVAQDMLVEAMFE